jgi:hypothetical protein
MPNIMCLPNKSFPWGNLVNKQLCNIIVLIAIFSLTYDKFFKLIFLFDDKILCVKY